MRILSSPPKVFYVYKTIRDDLEEYKEKYHIMKDNAETLAKRIDKAVIMLEKDKDKEKVLKVLRGVK